MFYHVHIIETEVIMENKKGGKNDDVTILEITVKTGCLKGNYDYICECHHKYKRKELWDEKKCYLQDRPAV